MSADRSAERLTLIALTFVCCLVETTWAAQQQKQVLVLYATRRDAQIAVVGDRDLPRILERGLAEGLDYYSEFLDEGRLASADYHAAFRDFLRVKYGGRRFDLVIAVGDLPLSFVVNERDALFGDTPVVYFADREASPPGNATGLIAELNLSGTLAMATELQPDTREVYVVVGASDGDEVFGEVAQEQFRAFEHRLTFTYLSGLPTNELEARLTSLPAHSIVYYLVVSQDGANQNFHPLDYLDLVTAAANAPVYSWVDSAMDHGIVGGDLKDQVLQTHAIANLALRVLRGEPADRIPASQADLNTRQVDWRQLRRWGISEARVPDGTVIRFRDPSAWDRYKVYILAALLLLLAQSGLIVGLLIQSIRRRQAEAEVLKNQAELRRSYERIRDLGSRLLNAQESERSRIARELHDDISQQMALLEIDLEQLNRGVQGNAEALTRDALSRAQGVAKSVHDLSHRLHPSKLRLIGLVAALHGLRRELSQPNMVITFIHDNVPPTLPEELTLCLFRIVQEALQNAIKHSRGHHVALQLRGGLDELTLTIVDHGVGFDVDRTWKKGLGLISMQERLEAVGGSLKVRSKPGAGTRLEVRVPVRTVPDTASIHSEAPEVPILDSGSNGPPVS